MCNSLLTVILLWCCVMCQTDVFLLLFSEKPVHPRSEDEDKSQFKMFQTIALSVAVAVAYIIAVLGLMFYCKQRRKNKRLQKNNAGEEPEMECLNGTCEYGSQTDQSVSW